MNIEIYNLLYYKFGGIVPTFVIIVLALGLWIVYCFAFAAMKWIEKWIERLQKERL